MTRGNAELTLRRNSGTCYLTRQGLHSKQYRLSVQTSDDGDIIHFKIKGPVKDGRTEYEIPGTENKFEDASKMLDFYQKIPVNLNVSSIGDPVQSIPGED